MKTSPSQLIAQNVRAEAARHRVSQRVLAHKLGMRQQSLSQRLLGRVSFRAEELEVIAQVFDMPVSALMGERTLTPTP
ncbi:helix-turn-helix domain-containing protein [Rhodococcus erythropolis]|uniref:helix-turn-helix domain-containing protein n=1 Tax=Rhodococcus erythropolis TaxID=1833 RepID=UPI00406BD9A1